MGKFAKSLKKSAAPKPVEELEQGTLKDKKVRVTDEQLGASAYGFLGTVVTHIGDKLLLKADGDKPRHIAVRVHQVEEMEGLKAWQQPSRMTFKVAERVELDMKFSAVELKEVDFKKDPRLASIHIEMLWWLLVRDLNPSDEVVFLRPEFTAQMNKELHTGSSECLNSLKVEVQGGKLIVLPVWAADPEHWTLLVLQKLESGWKARYRDSTSSGVAHKACMAAAKSLLSLLEVALSSEIQFPPELSNGVLQPFGSIVCGQFVGWFMELELRLYRGEGHSMSYPDTKKITDRLRQLSVSILKNSGVAACKAKEKKACEDAEAKVAAQKAEVLKSIVADKTYQEDTAKIAAKVLETTFGVVGGCSKCAWSKFGSTCCNPVKILCKAEAEKLFAEKQGTEVEAGKFDKKVYNNLLEKELEQMARTRGLPSVAPSVKHPGGGPDPEADWKGTGKFSFIISFLCLSYFNAFYKYKWCYIYIYYIYIY